MLAPRHLHSDPSAHTPLHLTLTIVVQRQFGMHTLICSPITRPYVETLTLSVRVGWTKLWMSLAMPSASSGPTVGTWHAPYLLRGAGCRASEPGNSLHSQPTASLWHPEVSL